MGDKSVGYSALRKTPAYTLILSFFAKGMCCVCNSKRTTEKKYPDIAHGMTKEQVIPIKLRLSFFAKSKDVGINLERTRVTKLPGMYSALSGFPEEL